MGEKKQKSKISKIIGYIFVGFLVVALAFMFYLTISIASKKITTIFGYSFHVVQSNSMETTIMTGDLVIAKSTSQDKVKVGDIVVFVCEDQTLPIYGEYVVHRVVEIDSDGNIWTQGDNRKTNPQKDRVPSKPIAKVISIKHANSSILLFLSQNRSLLLLIVVALSLVMVCVEFCSVVSNSKKLKKATEQEELEQQQLKEELTKEILEELKQNKKSDDEK